MFIIYCEQTLLALCPLMFLLLFMCFICDKSFFLLLYDLLSFKPHRLFSLLPSTYTHVRCGSSSLHCPRWPAGCVFIIAITAYRLTGAWSGPCEVESHVTSLTDCNSAIKGRAINGFRSDV